MATLLFGYDVENGDPNSDTTRRFLEQAMKVHDQFDAPCTLFVCGVDVTRELLGIKVRGICRGILSHTQKRELDMLSYKAYYEQAARQR